MKSIFKWSIVLLIFFLAFHSLDLNLLLSSLHLVPIKYFFYSTILLMVASIVAGTRWALFCEGLSIPDINYSRKLKVNFAASTLGYILPAGGSDAFRAMSVSINRTECGLLAFFTIAASRANGFVVALLSMSISACFLDISAFWKLCSISFSGLCLIFVFFIPLLLSRFNLFKNVPLQSVSLKKAWYKAFVLSFMFQMTLVLSRALLGWEIGVNLSWNEFVFISSLLFIFSPLLPSFGFIGLGTVGFVYFASIFGVNAEHAASLSIVWYVCWIISSLPGFLFMSELKNILNALKDKLKTKSFI